MFEKKIYLPYLLILLGILLIVYFYTIKSTSKKEGFVSTNWDQQTITNFLNFQQTKNQNLIFDVDVIQQQATQEEVNTLLKTGKWPWDNATKDLYMDAIKTNTMLKTSPVAAMEEAMTIYNQKIIKEMLSWNSAEGQFLLRGAYAVNTEKDVNNGSGTYGINSGLISKSNDLIRCGVDASENVVLQKIKNDDNDGITGAHKKVTSNLDYNDLPNLLPNFRFINSPCNPCAALNDPPKYTCPFSLTTKDPSPIWQNLWGLQSTASNANAKQHSKAFPILSELQSELNTLFPQTGITRT